MAFEIAGAVIGGEILAAGMTDVAIAAIAEGALAELGAEALLSVGAQEMAGWGIADAAAGGATETAVGSAVAETVGAGPAAASIGTEAAESTTRSLAQGLVGAEPAIAANSIGANAAETAMIDADSILAPTGSGAGGAATQAAETAMTQGAAAADKGILGSAMDFVKTPAGAMVAGQTVAGMLGGAGSAMGATRAAQIKAESDQRLLQERADIDRQQSISGTYNGPAMPTTVPGARLRYASNGQPIYGLVGSRLQRG